MSLILTESISLDSTFKSQKVGPSWYPSLPGDTWLSDEEDVLLLTSVLNPVLHGSGFFLASWIRIYVVACKCSQIGLGQCFQKSSRYCHIKSYFGVGESGFRNLVFSSICKGIVCLLYSIHTLQHLAYCKLWALTVLNARGMTTIFYLWFFMNGSSLTRTLFEFVLCCAELCSVFSDFCRIRCSPYTVVGFPPKGARKADIWFEDDRNCLLQVVDNSRVVCSSES
jgi:hypothetical protein